MFLRIFTNFRSLGQFLLYKTIQKGFGIPHTGCAQMVQGLALLTSPKLRSAGCLMPVLRDARACGHYAADVRGGAAVDDGGGIRCRFAGHSSTWEVRGGRQA
jgi:hypothetical protein